MGKGNRGTVCICTHCTSRVDMVRGTIYMYIYMHMYAYDILCAGWHELTLITHDVLAGP